MKFSKEEMKLMVQLYNTEILRLEDLLKAGNIYAGMINSRISMLKDIITRTEKELCV
jgi:hypothetical protein